MKNLQATPAQIQAIKDAADTLEAMIGCGENDSEWVRIVNNLNSLLVRNNLKQVKQ